MSESKKIGLDLLREPFLPNQISKLPKPTKKQTEDVKADYKKGIRCQICGTWHHPDVVHLDYVGHAALTDRLLDADPSWSWEPVAFDAQGLPTLDKDGGMWIKLTVCGVTRFGYGDAQGKSGGDATKERIGDALRNAAMRFGAALDLWHKGDLHVEDDDKHQTPPQRQQSPESSPPRSNAASEDDEEYIDEIKTSLKAIYGDNKTASLDKVEELTSFIPKGKTEVDRVKGVRDFTKLTGKRLEILAHNLRKLIPKNEPAICARCGQPVDTSGHCSAFSDCPNFGDIPPF